MEYSADRFFMNFDLAQEIMAMINHEYLGRGTDINVFDIGLALAIGYAQIGHQLGHDKKTLLETQENIIKLLDKLRAQGFLEDKK